VTVIEFVSIDGVMRDPDGREGFDRGGWAFRYGPEAVAGDKFKLGALLDTGALLVGRGPGSCSPRSGRPATIRSRPR